MRFVEDYDRRAAVRYAHRWAYGRNPAFYDYEELGGDCTNFASQCIFAGGCPMNFTPDFGWYYISADQKAPAWTGVEFLWNFLNRQEPSVGPVGEPCRFWELRPGDIVQLSFDGVTWRHTPVVVALRRPVLGLGDILVAAHSFDADDRPLNTYTVQNLRCLHITGNFRA